MMRTSRPQNQLIYSYDDGTGEQRYYLYEPHKKGATWINRPSNSHYPARKRHKNLLITYSSSNEKKRQSIGHSKNNWHQRVNKLMTKALTTVSTPRLATALLALNVTLVLLILLSRSLLWMLIVPKFNTLEWKIEVLDEMQ